MSAQKFKVFCTFDNDWDLSEWNIEFRKRNITSRDELLGEIKGCHGIVVYSLITVDKNLLDAAGDQLKVFKSNFNFQFLFVRLLVRFIDQNDYFTKKQINRLYLMLRLDMITLI